MQKKFTKATTLILMISMIFTMMLYSSSCAKQDPETKDNTDGTTVDSQATTAGEAETTTEKLYTYDGEKYNKYEMRILNLDQPMVTWAITNMVVAEETGDVINDSIYRRNALVEDMTGMTIAQTYATDPPAKIKKSVLANTDEYDISFTYANGAGPIASAGLYLDLKKIPTMNLTAPYWDQNANSSFTLFDKLYFTVTDAHVMTNDSIWVIYFNKKMLQDLQLEDPYKLVREGNWTMDKMLEMMHAAVADIDGDGEFTVGDRWGVSSHAFSTMAFLTCTDEHVVSKNAEGVPVLLQPSERFIAAYTKTREFLNKDTGMFLDAQGTYKGKSAEFDHPTKTFLADKSLFCTECLSHTRVFRAMENDFGLLPHPKLDSTQSQYWTLMVNTVPAFGIPKTNPNPERTGSFLDAMTGVSSYTIIPAYYDVSLSNKFFRDEDSIEMLDIIRGSRIFDLASTFSWAGFFETLQGFGFSKTGENPVTIYDKNSAKVEAAIQKTIEAFESFTD